MTKNIFCILIFACISLAPAGCATDIGIHDPSVPQEQLCTLKIERELYVHQFDGDDVKWYNDFLDFGAVVKIPAGRHSFVMNYVSGGSRYTRYADNLRYSHTFEAGRTYVMEAAVSNGRVTIEVKTE
jgi:hypothetical protein